MMHRNRGVQGLGALGVVCNAGMPATGSVKLHSSRSALLSMQHGVQGLAVLDLVRWGFGGLVMVGNARLPDSKLHSPRSSGALPGMAACY